jgi:hypothetical protein
MAGFRLMFVISTVATGLALDQFAGQVGFNLSTAVQSLVGGPLSDSVAGVRAVVFGTCVASLVPLLLWLFIIPWAEGREQSERMADEPNERQMMPVAGD